MKTLKIACWCSAVALAWSGWIAQAAGGRELPRPLPAHPGNIFLAGEVVTVAAPAGEGENWRVFDYEGRLAGGGRIGDGRAELGRLPVGYYEVARGEGTNASRVSVGVLEPLRAPTPQSSPIGIDVAMAWFYKDGKMAEAASLCALAGMNRVRDRLLWAELEPKRGEFSAATRYDSSAQAQSAAGLQVLQVGHSSPGWANPNGKRFPLDLRDSYQFHREMARRWQGQVGAFEPWNEADIEMFGGHTGSEMASLQKAAYLGLKAGNAKVIACLNVFAIHRAETLRDLQQNEAWPYFDTYNLHHYEPLNAYPRLYADHRAVSAGKPLWVTECGVPVKWSGDPQLKEPSPENLRAQGERVAKIYAQSLHEGAQAVFYFMLPHYSEGETQFGILRANLTPRPGFVAAAAAGRLLADAQPLGRVGSGSGPVHGFVFNANPDGKRAQVLVIWADGSQEFELPRPAAGCWDHLGRVRECAGRTLPLGPAPLYVRLARGTRLSLTPPPAPAERLSGKACPLVLQAVFPEESVVVKKSAYKIRAGEPQLVPVFLYNFGTKTARGTFQVTAGVEPVQGEAAEPWTVEFPDRVEIAPGERKELALRLTHGAGSGARVGTVRVKGDFGAAGKTVLSVRVVGPGNPKSEVRSPKSGTKEH